MIIESFTNSITKNLPPPSSLNSKVASKELQTGNYRYRKKCRCMPRYRRGTVASTMKSEVGCRAGLFIDPVAMPAPRVHKTTTRHHYGSRSAQTYRCTPPPAFPLCVAYVRAPTKLRGQRMHGRDLSIDIRPHEKHPRDAPSNGHATLIPPPRSDFSFFREGPASGIPAPLQNIS